MDLDFWQLPLKRLPGPMELMDLQDIHHATLVATMGAMERSTSSRCPGLTAIRRTRIHHAMAIRSATESIPKRVTNGY